jgi:endosialidase-like protein
VGNTHGVADMAKELQATTRDLLPACIVTTTWPTVPAPPSLTLAAFATAGYVRDGADLVYCDQAAHAVSITGGDGQYWLALTQDSWTTYATWNRVAGTQYAWKPSATRPPDVDGVLVAIQVTVSGGAITAVSPAPGVTRAEALRALAGLGTMATQNASAVAISGGTAGFGPVASPAFALVVDADGLFRGKLGVGNMSPGADTFLVNGTTFLQGSLSVSNPTGFGAVIDGKVLLRSRLGVGNIDAETGGWMLACNGSAAKPAGGSWADLSSMGKYKQDRVPLTGALDRLLQLQGYTYTHTHPSHAGMGPEMGFVAEEVQTVFPEWIIQTEPGEMSYGEQGMSALVVEALRELVMRLARLEAALGAGGATSA